MDENTIDFATKTQLVDALLDCPTMRDRNSRNQIVDRLTKIQSRIPRSETERIDVANIVERALDFHGGFAQLLTVLRFYEGDSRHMQHVDALYAQHGEAVEATPIPNKGKTDGAAPSSLNFRLIWLLISLLLFVGIVGIAILVQGYFGDSIPTEPEPTAIPSPTATPLPFAPATEGETLILVANFYLSDGIGDAEPHRNIAKAIREAMGQHKLADVRVEIEEAAQLRENEKEEARVLAMRHNASIIIWGDETTTDITVNFLNLRQPDYAIGSVTIEADDESVYIAALANPEPYTRFVTQDLPSQLTFLALFALAQSEYDREEYENAITLCELAIQYRKESQIQGLENVYFYLGQLYQTLNRDIDESIDYYDQAIEIASTFAAAYHNRGIAYGEQGNYEQALADLDQAIALYPNSVKFGNNRRMIHSFMNDSANLIPKPPSNADSTLGIGSTYINPVDGATYLYVPAGEFIMGSEGGSYNESPQRTVYLDSYWIMETEVTNAQYGKFMEAGGYTTEAYWSSEGWTSRTANNITQPRCWDDSNYNGVQQPVICVRWYEAEAYANWLSAESGLDFGLPTEAQWEKAARGSDGRIYPWGNQWDDSKANEIGFDDGYQYTAPVGSYPTGVSPYGVLDMAGNVWEWTADWYEADYYKNSPDRNPTGPVSGNFRVFRGGSWTDGLRRMRAANRNGGGPDNRNNGVGFRVWLSLSPD